MTLTLSDEEREVLSQALVHYVDELRREIQSIHDVNLAADVGGTLRAPKVF